MKRICPIIIAAALVTVSCSRMESEVTVGSDETDVAVDVTSMTSKVEIKVSEELLSQVGEDFASGSLETKSSRFNELAAELGIVSVKKVFGEDERYTERHRRAGLHLWFELTIDPSKATATKASESLKDFPGILESAPVHKICKADFNDPSFSRQWGMYQASGVDINVSDVWNYYGTGSNDVIVAVVDEGVGSSHEDLPTVIPGRGNGSWNFVNNTANVVPGDHGTHVAGVIAAANNNGIGVCGIAGGDVANGIAGVQILSCQIYSGDTNGNPAEAIRYAADNGALICQNSWGYEFDSNGDGQVTGEELEAARNSRIQPTLKTAVDYFIDYAGCDNNGNQLADSPMKGGLVVFAAGNNNIQYGVPANYERVIAVSSIDQAGAKSSFSNYGDWVDICAPGSGIYSTVVDGYSNMSGTSMACPHVSGVAALVLSIRGGYGFTNEMLWDCIIEGANSSMSPNLSTMGPMLDAMGAVTYGLEDVPEAITEISAESNSNSIIVSWAVPSKAESDEAAYGGTVFVSRDASAFDSLNPASPGSAFRVSTLVTAGNAAGETVSTTITGLDFSTDYYVTVAPFNYGLHYGDYPAPVLVTTGENNAPVITPDRDVTGLELKASESVTINFSISDPDGHSYTINYTAGSSAENAYIPSGGTAYAVRIAGNGADAGVYEGVLTVTDAYGLSSVCTISYELLANEAPVVISTMPSVLMNVGQQREISLGDYFTDPDGDNIIFSVSSSNSSCVHASCDVTTLYLLATAAGATDISVTARDARGASVGQTFRLVVRAAGEIADIYPTQVTDSFNVATGEDVSTVHVTVVSSSTGKTMLEADYQASAYEPASVDVTSLAPGRYVVTVSYGGNSVTRQIVKL